MHIICVNYNFVRFGSQLGWANRMNWAEFHRRDLPGRLNSGHFSLMSLLILYTPLWAKLIILACQCSWLPRLLGVVHIHRVCLNKHHTHVTHNWHSFCYFLIISSRPWLNSQIRTYFMLIVWFKRKQSLYVRINNQFSSWRTGSCEVN